MRKVIVPEYVTLDGVMEYSKNPNAAAGALSSGTRIKRCINSMNYLRAALSCWDGRRMRALQQPGRL